MADDGDWNPTRATSLEQLSQCLEYLRDQAGSPSTRALEAKTKHAGGTLPSTNLSRIPLGRNAISEMLSGRKFPKRKEFFLTFVEACGVDLETDRRWEEAWDRLYLQRRDRQDHDSTAEVEQLRQQLDVLRQELAEVKRESGDAANTERQSRELRPQPRQARASEETAGRDHPHVLDGLEARGRRQVMLTHAAAETLLGQARNAALAISEKPTRVATLAEVAKVWWKLNPGRARQVFEEAQSSAALISEPYERACAFAAVAKALAAYDQAGSTGLFDTADGAASKIRDLRARERALAAVARMMASSDPKRAVSITEAIQDQDQKAWALADIVRALAYSDLDQAESLAKSITSVLPKSRALIAVVEIALQR